MPTGVIGQTVSGPTIVRADNHPGVHNYKKNGSIQQYFTYSDQYIAWWSYKGFMKISLHTIWLRLRGDGPVHALKRVRMK